MMNKRGMSEVLTLVMIILLVLIGIAIVWAVVIPLIRGPTEDLTTSCITIQTSIDSAVFNKTSNQTVVSVKRATGEGDVVKMAIIIDGARSDVAGELEELATEKYIVNTTTKPAKIEIAPILSRGEDEETMCDIKDSTTNILQVS